MSFRTNPPSLDSIRESFSNHKDSSSFQKEIDGLSTALQDDLSAAYEIHRHLEVFQQTLAPEKSQRRAETLWPLLMKALTIQNTLQASRGEFNSIRSEGIGKSIEFAKQTISEAKGQSDFLTSYWDITTPAYGGVVSQRAVSDVGLIGDGIDTRFIDVCTPVCRRIGHERGTSSAKRCDV